MAKIDLTNSEWIDIVFGDRNKKYGAYALRLQSAIRHNKSTLIIALIAIIGFSIPKLISLATPKKQRESITEVTTLSKLDKAEVKNEIKKPIAVEPPPALKSSIKFVAPVIKKDEEVSDENELKSQEELNKSAVAISIADVKGNDEVHGVDIADVKVAVTQQKEEDDDKVFEVIEQMPSFPGGEAALMDFISKNIRYPVSAQENGIQGRVILRFVVTKTGDIGKVEVVRGVDPALDKEAIRVVKSLPKWIPGKQNGENVNVWFTLPITFKLQ